MLTFLQTLCRMQNDQKTIKKRIKYLRNKRLTQDTDEINENAN